METRAGNGKKRIYRFRLVRKNMRTFLTFEAILKLLAGGLGIPALYRLLELFMTLAGYPYLTAENIRAFLIHPLFFCFVLIAVFVFELYVLFELNALTLLFHCSYHKKKAPLFSMISYAGVSIKEMMRSGDLPGLALYVLLFAPIYNISLLPGILSSFGISDYFMRRIVVKYLLYAASAVVILLFVIFFPRWIYVYQCYLLENPDFKTARKRSLQLGKGHRITDLGRFLGVQVLWYVLYLIILAAGIFLALVSQNQEFRRYLPLSSKHTTTILTLMMTVLILFLVLGTTVSYTCISALYYRHREEEREAGTGPEIMPPEKLGMKVIPYGRNTRLFLFFELVMLIGAVLIGADSVYLYYKGEFNPKIEALHKVEVTAHRGASRYFPENTMSAFGGAIRQEADWIELDIQQSSDGQIFIMHDSNFRRTTGVDANCWEMTYQDIRHLNAAATFKGKSRWQWVPSLAQVLDYAKEKGIRLNIEVKLTGHEKNFEGSLVDLLREKEFTDQCVVTSQQYIALRRIKRIAPEIKTVYVMGFAYGRINDIRDADAYSVKARYVTRQMVADVHNSGKEIYAWTVNDRYMIAKMHRMGVDNLITDDVPLAKDVIGREVASDAVNYYVRTIRRWIVFW